VEGQEKMATEVTHLPSWIDANSASFVPPVCNKLMHHGQLSVMFIGGPNEREDFHLEMGSEFFYQMRGNMVLPIIQQGKRRDVHIKEGHVFLLPSRVPHSPQRPENNSVGLVIERHRRVGEIDGLRWYVDFTKCERILYEKYFQCEDLGKDLVPVVKAYKASDEFTTRVPGAHVESNPPLIIDTTTEVPDPFPLKEWLDTHRAELAKGAELLLFPGHPDKEFTITIIGSACETAPTFSGGGTADLDTWIYQLEGKVEVVLANGKAHTLSAEASIVVLPATPFTVTRSAGSVTMLVTQSPHHVASTAPA